MRKRGIASLAVIAAGLGACSAADQAGQGTPAALPAPSADAATRSQPVVPGRLGRVYVFAGVGKTCESLPAPELTIASRPSKGELSFVPGQETVIAASAQGTCLGAKARGTGVYYMARAGTSGTDTFSISAKLATGETTTRIFQVTIAE
jgi:hypothetical protein